MTRDELIALREGLQTLVDSQKRLGDYDTNAAAIRAALEACLRLTQHLIDRMKRS